MDQKIRMLSFGIGLLAASLASGPASAATIEYSSLASFQAATTAPVVETYSNIAAPFGSASIDGKTINGISYSGGYAVVWDAQNNPANFDWGTGAVLELRSMGGIETLTFATPVTAFGALFGNILPNASTVYISLPGNPITAPQQTLMTNTFPNLAFFGWTSDTPFSSVTIQGSDAYSILDNVTLAVAVVPEPSTYSMILAGLGMMALAVRRRLGS
jgi:hypothetical protein